MMSSIFLRTLYDKRWFILGWSVALAVMGLLMVFMYPSLREGMEEIAATMPPQLQGLVGDMSNFRNIDSYLASQLYDIRIPIFLMIMAAVLANGIGVGAEERGVLRTVLSGKLSRVNWFIQTWLASVVMFAVVLVVTSIATLFSIWAIGESISLTTLTELAILTLSFAVTVFTIIFGIGAATGKKSVTLGVGVGIIISSFILEAGKTVDWLESAQTISLLNYYDAASLISDGLNMGHQLILLSLLLISFILGILFFRRRDIN